MVLTQDLQGGGGAEKFIANLSLVTADTLDFVFVCPQQRAPHADHTFPFRGRVIPLDLGWEVEVHNPFGKLTRFVRRLQLLRRIIERDKPDVILSNFSYVMHYLAVTLKLARLVKPKVVLRFGNSVREELGRRRGLYVWFFKRIIVHADCLIANSNGVADELRTLVGVSPRKIVTINNPVPIDRIITLAGEGLADDLFERRPVVLNVGRFAEQKNQALLLRAFAIARKHVDAQLILIGAGPLEGNLRALCMELGLERNVYILGWQDNPYKYMRRADLFVLSSNYEGFPNSVVEAMACGCPVISTDCPYGPAEILKDGKYGVLVPVGDEQALAREMVRLLNDHARRAELTRLGNARAAEFDARHLAGQYVELYQRMATR